MTERWLHELRELRHVEPPESLRDRAANLVREHAGAARRPRGTGPAGSRRAWSAIAAAAAIALLAGAVIGIRLTAGTGWPPGTGHGGVYKDPRFGWTMRYPSGLLAQHITAQFRWSLDGVRITNFPADLRNPTGGEPETGWLRSFPPAGVAAQIWYLGGPPGPTPMRSSRFPLGMSSFHRVRPYAGGAEPAPAYRTFAADGYSFSAAVWTGPHASRADKRAIWHAIGSLRFPRLRQGTIWAGSVYVLGHTRDYPAGSVTAFAAPSLPTGPKLAHPRGFYLVHAAGGRYVVERLFTAPAPPGGTCRVSFDRVASEFHCQGTRLRWNLAGRQLGPRSGSGQGWDLSVRTAVVATDGHVLFGPSFSSVAMTRMSGAGG